MKGLDKITVPKMPAVVHKIVLDVGPTGSRLLSIDGREITVFTEENVEKVRQCAHVLLDKYFSYDDCAAFISDIVYEDGSEEKSKSEHGFTKLILKAKW